MTSTAVDLAPPVPTPGREMPTDVADERKNLEKFTAQAASRDTRAEDAFLAARIHMVATHPKLDRAERERSMEQLAARIDVERVERSRLENEDQPVPGGVGYGMFYNSPFRSAFARGTSLYFDIICPNPPGGNISTWFYLTGMNRAGRGIEAFVSYNGQSEPRLKVFDWARTDQWQTDVPFGNLSSYLGPISAHGTTYQTLGVWNSTFEIAAGQWRNEALLWNRVAARWDLIYRFDYAGTQTQQTTGWIGSWGPIVETFEPSYQNTARFGALNTMLISRNSSGSWGTWTLLDPVNSYIRTDNVGFSPVFVDPNYAFAVDS